MNECRELEPLLASYVDDEADAAGRTRVDAHVDACRACRDRLAGQRATREALHSRRDEIRDAAPPVLRERCAAAARRGRIEAAMAAQRGAPGAARVPAFRRWMPLTAAATVLLAVVSVFALGLNQKAYALAFQTTVDHIKCVRFSMSGPPADPTKAAEQWQAKFGWPIHVPASSTETRLELRAVRRCAVTDGRVAHLMYLWRGEPLSVYVLPVAVLGSARDIIDRFGHESIMWSQNGRTYMVVSKRRRDPAIDTVVAYVRANAF